MTSRVLVALRVKADPERAFDIFVDEIGRWWRPDPLFQITPRGDGTLAFERGADGAGARLVTTLASGKVFEIGRVLDWRRGERLAFSWRQAPFAPDQETRVEVRFEPVGEETRVTLVHYGWTDIPRENAARHGFPDAVTQARVADWWRRSLSAFEKISVS